MVYGVVPPVAEIVASPSHKPLQLTFDIFSTVMVGPPFSLTLKVSSFVQPSTSSTVTVYGPANKFGYVVPVPEPTIGLQFVVYGEEPPTIEIVMEPSELPQFALVTTPEIIISLPSVIVAVAIS